MPRGARELADSASLITRLHAREPYIGLLVRSIGMMCTCTSCSGTAGRRRAFDICQHRSHMRIVPSAMLVYVCARNFKRDGRLVSCIWGFCGYMLIRSSTVWLLPFTLLQLQIITTWFIYRLVELGAHQPGSVEARHLKLELPSSPDCVELCRALCTARAAV